MTRTSAVSVAVICAAAFVRMSLPAQAQSMDENEFVMIYRNAELQTQGAAASTQSKIVQTFAREQTGRLLHVASAVVEGFLENDEAWNCFGLPTVSGISCGPNFGTDDSGKPGLLSKRGTWATVRKSYQDREIVFNVLLNSSSLVDAFRVGQKVTFTGAVFNVYTNQVAIIDAQISAETHTLRCANGHEYAPSAGYKFCPQCGQPLK